MANIYDLLKNVKYNYIEPNNLKGLQPGFVVAQESRVASGLLTNGLFENGKICKLTEQGIEAGDANAKALFIHYTEPLNTMFNEDRLFAVNTEEECPRLVQLIPGDEWMSTDPNCAIEGRIVKLDGKGGWYNVTTMADGVTTGYHYMFLG